MLAAAASDGSPTDCLPTPPPTPTPPPPPRWRCPPCVCPKQPHPWPGGMPPLPGPGGNGNNPTECVPQRQLGGGRAPRRRQQGTSETHRPISCGVVLPPQVLYICFTGQRRRHD